MNGMIDVTQTDLGVTLRPVTRNDLPWMFQLETDPSIIWRFRLGGRAKSIDEYENIAFSQVLAQAIVVSNADASPIGLVYADKYDPTNGTAEFGLVAHPNSTGTGLVLHGMLLFIDRLFEQFSLRKLVGESLEFNIGQFANGTGMEDFSGVFSIETVFPAFYFLDGRYWDRFQIAIFREDWINHRAQMIQSASNRMDRIRGTVKTPPTEAAEGDGTTSPSPVTGAFKGISMESERFILRAITPEQQDWCTSILAAGSRSYSLRFHSVTLGPNDIALQLWGGVLCHFAVWDKRTNVPIALVCAYDVAGALMTGFVHAVIDTDAMRTGECKEALLLFIQFMFSSWPLRKLYIRYVVVAPELDVWKEALEVEGTTQWESVGVQQRHVNDAGVYFDQEIFELTRERWDSIKHDLSDQLVVASSEG